MEVANRSANPVSCFIKDFFAYLLIVTINCWLICLHVSKERGLPDEEEEVQGPESQVESYQENGQWLRQ